uniref:Uncharacterized protein n=1 Tax=Arundo donax TaxID=35708 RepID=A0A0A9TT68_ARUDO
MFMAAGSLGRRTARDGDWSGPPLLLPVPSLAPQIW